MSIAHRYTRHKVEAEEILNDTFYKVFKYLTSYNKDFPFISWLKKIAINSCITYYQKYKNEFSTVDIDSVSYSTIKIQELAETSLGEKYVHIIKQLPPAYRAVFNLYVFEEYKHREIAELLNINIGTSKSNLKRAKDKVREMLDQYNMNHSKKDIADG